MDYREKKKILEQYRKTPDSIKRLREMVRELESEAEKITATIAMDGGGGYAVDTAKLQRCVERLDDIKMRLLAEEAEREEVKTKIFSAVSALKDERERSVIYGHYIQGKSFQSLCFKLCYSRAQIFRFARRGIEHISLKVGT